MPDHPRSNPGAAGVERGAGAAAPGAAAASIQPLGGIACMVAGVALASLSDVVLKLLGGKLPIGEMLAVRAPFIFVPIAWFVWRGGGLSALRVKSPLAQAARAALTTGALFMFIEGLRWLPLADAIAITMAAPLFVTALAPAMLGERADWRRWAAVAVGFAGVLLIVRPAGGIGTWAALWPLGAALLQAVRDLLTRRVSLTDSSTATLFYSTVLTGAVGAATLPFGWEPMAAEEVALLAATGLLLGGAHYLLIETFRLAEAAVVAPFFYTYMVWAAIFGFLVWGHVPDLWVAAGSSLVVASGLYILERERRRRRAAAPLRP